MSLLHLDPRLAIPRWDAGADTRTLNRKVRLLTLANAAAAVWYFTWLLSPDRPGAPLLYGALVAAELYNLVQAAGFWWTCCHQRIRPDLPPVAGSTDVYIPVYNEPVAVVEATVAAAARIRGERVTVCLLDDGRSPAMAALAARHGARYLTRPDNLGAKAGNINAALPRTQGDHIAVFDCDHVPDSRFLEGTLGQFADPAVAFVQTPQYYANTAEGGVAAGSWAQQALFFGAIARGKDGLDAIFCCGTNVVFRRAALESVGGFPTSSVTEDFQLSLALHEHGWRSVYVARVLARGLAPEDMASYLSQQQRWARGCLSALPAALRAHLPWRLKLQYVLSSLFFLSGWTVAVYFTLPVVALITGTLPVSVETADEYLLHFAPYWGLALLTVSVAGASSYTFAAFKLWAATFWVHVFASVKVVLRRPGGFVVTPKRGAHGRQPRTVIPTLAAAALLACAAAYGLATDATPGTLNNVAFAVLHLTVLLGGVWPALCRRSAADRPAQTSQPAQEQAA